MGSSFKPGSFHLPFGTFMVAFTLHLASLRIDRRNCSYLNPFLETCFMVGLAGLLYSIVPSIVKTSYSYTSLIPISNSEKE
jgi:hypothetical protein